MRQLSPITSFLWALGSLALGVALYAGYRAAPDLSPFVLRGVRVEGARRTPPDEIRRAADLVAEGGMFEIDVEEVRRRIERLPWVRKARVLRQLPSTLLVEVEEWVPRFLVRLDRLYYMTAEGHVIRAPLDQGFDFPVVTGVTAADLVEGTRTMAALKEWTELGDPELPGAVSELRVDPSEGLALYTDGDTGMGILFGFDDFREKLARLDRLDRHLARRGQAAYAIDLTYYDKIVARLARGKDPRP